jgi:hypothetical protein
MTSKILRLRFIFLVVAIMSVFSFGCGNGESENGDDLAEGVDSTKGNLLTVNGEIFSIPSPIQTALLIKKSGANYNKEMLNTSQKASSYSTSFKKALNLGIYGADLGYVTIYEQTQDAISYLNSAKKIADDLGVSGAFDAQTIDRFQKNLGSKDSMLTLVSVAYRASDAYLKNNDRNEISGLILTGGWIESLTFATNVFKMKGDAEVKRRIAEQKLSLNSLIKLLTPYYSQPEYAELIDGLKEVSAIFDSVEFKYVYEKPTVDVEKKLTIVNSKTEAVISDEQVKTISEKIQSIRNQIVG